MNPEQHSSQARDGPALRRPDRLAWRVLGLAFALVAGGCALRVELAEHRPATGDLAATSMGLASQERWVPEESGGVDVSLASAARLARRAVEEPLRIWRSARRAQDRESREPALVLAPDLELAQADTPPAPRWLQAALDGGRAILPAAGPPGTRSRHEPVGAPLEVWASDRPYRAPRRRPGARSPGRGRG